MVRTGEYSRRARPTGEDVPISSVDCIEVFSKKQFFHAADATQALCRIFHAKVQCWRSRYRPQWGEHRVDAIFKPDWNQTVDHAVAVQRNNVDAVIFEPGR